MLVHGWSCDRTYWNAQLESLSRDFTVVTVDLAGHGESGCGREASSIAAFGSDVALVVTLNGLEDVVLVGHSMGGDIILEAAGRLSPRVGGLSSRHVSRSSRNEQQRRRSAEDGAVSNQFCRRDTGLCPHHVWRRCRSILGRANSTRYVSCPCRCCAWGHGGSLDLRPRRPRAAE